MRFSSDSRNGPGCISTVPTGAFTLLKTIDSVCRSRVGSPLTSMNCVPWVTGSNTMTKSFGNCTDSTAFSPGGNSIEVDGELGEAVAQCLRQIDARAPENLPVIFGFGQRVGIMGGDAAHARAHGEGDLDHLVERRLVARGAEPAGIFLVIDGLEGRAGIEHPAAAGAQHVPRQFEQAEPGGVQECSERHFLVETVLGGEIEHVDAAEIAIGRFADRPLDGGNAAGIGRLPQHAEKSFQIAHRW